MQFLTNKRVFITGICGTVGTELLRQLTSGSCQPAEIVGVDQNESELFFLEQQYIDDPRVSFFLGNIRDRQCLEKLMRNIDVVFHAAALKHISLCERAPLDVIQTNIMGVQNVIDAASHNRVEVVIFTSSDKAVNPANVMGTSKLMGERLITAANNTKRGAGPVFASTRFGNVVGSSGSVVPVFRQQIAAGGPVTLTDPEMTRFVISIEEAAKLVLESVGLVHGGEVLVTKLPVIRIADLAKVMIRELAPHYGHEADNIEIRVIGTKPGEKLYEELVSTEETRRAVELKKFFSVLPAFRDPCHKVDYSYDEVVNRTVSIAYSSANEVAMTRQELTDFMKKNRLLESNSRGG